MQITASPAAVQKAIDVAGQYLEWLGKFDFREWTPEEFTQFIRAIADEVAGEDVVPF